MTDKNIEIHSKVWGEEQWIANKDYCGKLLKLSKGWRCSIHYHKNKEETFYILKGKVLMEVGDREWVMNPGEKIDIKSGDKHRFTGLQNSEIMEFSTHHEEKDSYRDVPSGQVPLEEFDLLLTKY